MNDESRVSSHESLILITGGAGFIGSHTCDALLASGYRVRILDLLDPQVHGSAGRFPAWLDDRVECLQGDVRNREDVVRAVAGVDAIFHFAAQTGVGQSMYEIHSYYDINIGGTAMLLDVLANMPHRVRRIILSSSRAVYGEGACACPSCGPVRPPSRNRSDLENGHWRLRCQSCSAELFPVPTVEGQPVSPLSVYAETKRGQEELLRLFSGAYGVSCVILRYFNVYGARQALGNPYTGIGPIFVSRVLAGRPVSIYEDGLQGRDFVNVRDVVQANMLALERASAGGGTFNIGSGERLTVLDLARHICHDLKAPEQFAFEGLFRVGDIRDCYADLAHSRSVLGYEPKVPFPEGVGELVDWAGGQQYEDRLGHAEAELKARKLM